MKTKLTSFGMVIMLMIAGSAFGQHASLEVTVKNIKEAKGEIRVGLFDNEKDFLEKAVIGKIVKASGAEVTVLFENVKPGDYGLSVFHDENENGELDSNFVGIPKEGFAFGNNAMGMFGPPSFDKALVHLKDEKVVQVISLKYL